MNIKNFKEERKLICFKCVGCINIEEVDEEFIVCKTYLNPTSKWRICDCPFATHVEIKEEKEIKKRVGQQKQKKKK